jgi:hypothetical protein
VRHHDLKCWPDQFVALWARTKRHEVRRADRDYVEGDTVRIREFLSESQRYTGRSVRGLIGNVTNAGPVGSNVFLPDPIVVFTFIEHARTVEPESES